jgi:hypothetical protein
MQDGLVKGCVPGGKVKQHLDGVLFFDKTAAEGKADPSMTGVTDTDPEGARPELSGASQQIIVQAGTETIMTETRIDDEVQTIAVRDVQIMAIETVKTEHPAK